ncbi:alpha/beta hydrolase-fold protein [Flaviaesturariibacter amylovorans]|uniref:Alpha/beta hydrolase n=1 Tax=Flaviaesturariibacter amylovorans TaxID=1084520 RepID=A0ABP8GFI1_9BACT
MKQSTLLFFALFFSLLTYAQPDNRVTIGTIDTLQSTILHEKRKLLVHVPQSSGSALYGQQKYPVLYLLDGDAHFNSVVGMMQHLSRTNGNTLCPEMIVVGIANTNRTRDLTPTKTGDDPFLKQISGSVNAAVSGGGEAFLSFIEKELMPYIDAKYPTQPYKMLVGHSFGGLTAMNVLINHTRLFNTYVAIDPSLWWDDLNFLKATEKALSEKSFAGVNLYLAIANTMDEGMTVKKVVKDTTLRTRGMRAALGLDRFIRSRRPAGLTYAGNYYDNDTHNSVPLIALYDAFRTIFKDYQLHVENRDVLDSTVDLSAKFRLRYQKISKLYGYEVKPPEAEVNTYGYRFLQRKQFAKAEGFFKLNLENYPGSFNVYDSYGDFFLAKGDKDKAVAQFEKALSIREDARTREKLVKLKQ